MQCSCHGSGALIVRALDLVEPLSYIWLGRDGLTPTRFALATSWAIQHWHGEMFIFNSTSGFRVCRRAYTPMA